MTSLDVPAHNIMGIASAIRHERYGPATETGTSLPMTSQQRGEIARQLDFAWVGVPPHSVFNGRTLEPNPDGRARLAEGDIVAVLGTRDQMAGFERAVGVATTESDSVRPSSG
jgi:hypothetical protein